MKSERLWNIQQKYAPYFFVAPCQDFLAAVVLRCRGDDAADQLSLWVKHRGGRRWIRAGTIAFVASVVLCNGLLYAVEVGVARSPHFAQRYETGLNMSLISAGEYLMSMPTPPGPRAESAQPREGGNAIYKIDKEGLVREIFRQPVLVLSMIVRDGTLLVGTGSEGQIYQINPGQEETVVRKHLAGHRRRHRRHSTSADADAG